MRNYFQDNHFQQFLQLNHQLFEHKPSQWKSLIVATKEIESFFKNTSLDIEFALTKNDKVIIFQVRPLTTIKSISFSDYQIKKPKSLYKLVLDGKIPEEIFIPDEFIDDLDLRLSIYKRISNLNNNEELSNLILELRDRFGPIPKELNNLFNLKIQKKIESQSLERVLGSYFYYHHILLQILNYLIVLYF